MIRSYNVFYPMQHFFLHGKRKTLETHLDALRICHKESLHVVSFHYSRPAAAYL